MNTVQQLTGVGDNFTAAATHTPINKRDIHSKFLNEVKDHPEMHN